MESWRLEAETGDPLTPMELETGRPTVSSHHRWWAECEQRGWQDVTEMEMDDVRRWERETGWEFR